MSNLIQANNITIVIPVKNNQAGITRYLDTFFQVTPPDQYVKSIIIVDNNSDIPIVVSNVYPIPVIITQTTTPGPGAARNCGVKLVETDWILFNDSDCIPTTNTVSGYCVENHANHKAFQGMYHVLYTDELSSFYQQFFASNPICQIDPASMIHSFEHWQPSYLVTANCLINKKIFDKVGGFDEHITIVASEDVELGIRLKKRTTIGIQDKSITNHTCDGGLSSFVDRYIRYGRGVRYTNDKHHIYPMGIDVKPATIKSCSGLNIPLYSLFFINFNLGVLIGLDS